MKYIVLRVFGGVSIDCENIRGTNNINVVNNNNNNNNNNLIGSGGQVPPLPATGRQHRGCIIPQTVYTV
jgi:hypothetical protein